MPEAPTVSIFVLKLMLLSCPLWCTLKTVGLDWATPQNFSGWSKRSSIGTSAPATNKVISRYTAKWSALSNLGGGGCIKLHDYLGLY